MDLVSDTYIGDWYQYFYEPTYQQDTVVLTDLVDAALLDLPAYGDGVLTVTLTRTGGIVSCGALVPGMYADFGGTRYGASTGIVDYSQVDRDDYGNTTIVERAYSKTLSAEVRVARSNADTVSQILTAYRATPMVFIGSDDDGALIVYGFAKDWELTYDLPTWTRLRLEVEGLT
jgi:hypothetical protein